jgi:hypothetical protein
VGTFNPGGGAVDGISTELTVRMADKFNNPVPDGTVALFTTEYGVIVSTCETTDGVCTATWSSQSPRLPLFNTDLIATLSNRTCPFTGLSGYPCRDSLGQIFGLRSTILVTAIGEESFTDLNGNGLWDPGEPHADLPEAFLDNNESGVYNGDDNCTPADDPTGRDCASGLEETFVDFNNNGLYDAGNGIYNGTLCSVDLDASGQCSRELVSVRDNGIVIMTTGGPRWIMTDSAGAVIASDGAAGTGIPPVTASATYSLYLSDQYNNVPTQGTAVSVSSDSCDVLASETAVSNTAQYGAYRIDLFFTPDPANTEAAVGNVDLEIGGTTYRLGCTDPIN